ncbi:unnamed protein product [Cyclocybe aegerita]|uniref:HAT C-terminal dimerisation domain-containing protein n=1 Tax=Cyclocybe aegerita TaxID=1973307 RepID=A0A8S0WAS9_CYCAE|nr:unnamed protein product [Cyclocybe aegerita]
MWREVVLLKQLKGWEELGVKGCVEDGQNERERETFTLAGFYQRLVRWIAVDDQSINVVDCPELRDLLLYISVDLKDSDIPHRTKLSELITEAFKREYARMLLNIQTLEGYMAVTVHYAAKSKETGNLLIRTQLVAFRQLYGSHSGINIGKVFLQIIKEIDCLNKLSMFTMDNASNNDTMMEDLENELHKLGIPFDREGNQIRCFPHVINLAVKEALSLPTFALPRTRVHVNQTLKTLKRACTDNNIRNLLNPMLWLQLDDLLLLVGHLDCIGRSLSGSFEKGTKQEAGEKRSKALRFLEQYPAVKKMIEENSDMAAHEFSDMDLEVLRHIFHFLHYFHVIQEIVSGERTPTLSIVLPMYEKLITMLRDLHLDLPQIAHAIDAFISKLEAYLKVSRRTKVYALAMVLNPMIGFQWIEKNWSSDEYQAAYKAVHDALLEFQHHKQKEEEKDTPTPTRPSLPEQPATRRIERTASASHAALAQRSRWQRFNALGRPTTAGVPQSPEEIERVALEADKRIVDEAIVKYKAACANPDCDDSRFQDFDLLQWWQVHQGEHELFWRLALDVLPVQASAVPCEHVFSSSKETDVCRWSKIAPLKMEELQMLKFIYRNDWLTFADGLVCTEQEFMIDELRKYIDKSLKGWGAEKKDDASSIRDLDSLIANAI